MRTSTYAAQGINTLTRPLLLKNLHKLEQNDKRHLHVVYLTDREGENPDTVISLDLKLVYILNFFLCHCHSCQKIIDIFSDQIFSIKQLWIRCKANV